MLAPLVGIGNGVIPNPVIERSCALGERGSLVLLVIADVVLRDKRVCTHARVVIVVRSTDVEFVG